MGLFLMREGSSEDSFIIKKSESIKKRISTEDFLETTGDLLAEIADCVVSLADLQRRVLDVAPECAPSPKERARMHTRLDDARREVQASRKKFESIIFT